MLGAMGSFGGFVDSCKCCQRIRKVYVPNLPKELQGKRFSSEEEMLLVTNIRVSDYQSDVVCDK